MNHKTKKAKIVDPPTIHDIVIDDIIIIVYWATPCLGCSIIFGPVNAKHFVYF